MPGEDTALIDAKGGWEPTQFHIQLSRDLFLDVYIRLPTTDQFWHWFISSSETGRIAGSSHEGGFLTAVEAAADARLWLKANGLPFIVPRIPRMKGQL